MTLSLPLWERGLKFLALAKSPLSVIVAPFVGAWIEIGAPSFGNSDAAVAPFVGAWIEINTSGGMSRSVTVAPFVGAWIEMYPFPPVWFVVCCRSLCGSVD